MSASARGAAGARPVPRRLLPDSRLAKLAADGDTRAFEVIFERHHQELYRYCRAILASPDDAQDALQNTMAAALRSLPGERREISLRPWLFRVAHNEAISIARRRSDSAPVLESDVIAPSAAADAHERERLRSLVTDLNALPERQRGALVMRELSDLSYGEIAATLGISEGAARQLVHEAREAMRETSRGREMNCAEIREAISTRDGRILRGRKVSSHLRSCEGCNDYLAALSRRRDDLQALVPPLPALAATGLIAGVLGEAGKTGIAAGVGTAGAGAGSGGAGVLASAGGAAAGASAVTKGGAVIAALVVATGAAGVSGVVDLPLVGGDGSGDAPSAEQAQPAAASGAEAGSGDTAGTPSTSANGNANGQGNGNASGDSRSQGNGRGNANGHSQSAAAGSQGQGVPAGGSDGVTGPPEQANGHGPPDSAGTGTGNAGGNSASSNGVSASPPRSASGAEHSNAGAGGPPAHANGEGNPHD